MPKHCKTVISSPNLEVFFELTLWPLTIGATVRVRDGVPTLCLNEDDAEMLLLFFFVLLVKQITQNCIKMFLNLEIYDIK